MKANIYLRCEGVATATVISQDGTVKSKTQENLVLDKFNTQFVSGNGGFNPEDEQTRIKIGTGTVEPNPTQTNLDVYGITLPAPSVNEKNPVRVGNDVTYEVTFTSDSQVGGATGNWTEVGLAFKNDAGVHTRLLFRDIQGNPTTITVLETDRLVIAYTFKIIQTLTDTQTTEVISGNTYTVTVRSTPPKSLFVLFSTSAYIGVASGTLSQMGDAGLKDNRSVVFGTTTSGVSVVNGVYSKKLGTAEGNGSITGFWDGWSTTDIDQYASRLKFHFDPPIVKTSNNTLDIQFSVQRVAL